jgi:uncharacterized radical SAM superfamily protein
LAREEFKEMLDQGALLLSQHRGVINEARLAALDEENHRLLSRLDSLGEPDGRT